MKPYIHIIVAVLLAPFFLCGQSNVGIGTNTPDSSAKMDVSSSTQGLLIPRMTEAQRNAINSPATSLTIFQTDNTTGFYYYDGSSWRMLGDNLGSHLANQILDMDTNRIVNVSAPINGLDAVNKDYVDAAITGGGGGANLGSGMPTEISNESASAMKIGIGWVYCDSLTEGGNSDWVMPSHQQLAYAVSGGCVLPGSRSTNFLWTSTNQLSNYFAHYLRVRLSDGYTQAGVSSSESWYVRCVR